VLDTVFLTGISRTRRHSSACHVVPRRDSENGPALATECQQVVLRQLRQLVGTDRVAAADPEVADIAPVGDDRGLGQPAGVTQEPAVALEQLGVERLDRYRVRDRAFLAQHREQVCQTAPHMPGSPPRPPVVAAADRQMPADEVLDGRLVESTWSDFSLRLVQDSAQVDHGVRVFPVGPVAIAALAQPLHQANGLAAQRRILPPRVEQTVPTCFLHLCLLE